MCILQAYASNSDFWTYSFARFRCIGRWRCSGQCCSQIFESNFVSLNGFPFGEDCSRCYVSCRCRSLRSLAEQIFGVWIANRPVARWSAALECACILVVSRGSLGRSFDILRPDYRNSLEATRLIWSVCSHLSVSWPYWNTTGLDRSAWKDCIMYVHLIVGFSGRKERPRWWMCLAYEASG